MAEIILLVSLVAAFCVLLVKKLGIAEYVQVHGNRFMSQLFSCDLCMSFWAAVVISTLIAVIEGDALLLVVPLFSTPITRMLV